MSADFVELCAHSWFSFGAGAASVAELVMRAADCGYPAQGMTDVSNFCGALAGIRSGMPRPRHPIGGAR